MRNSAGVATNEHIRHARSFFVLDTVDEISVLAVSPYGSEPLGVRTDAVPPFSRLER